MLCIYSLYLLSYELPKLLIVNAILFHFILQKPLNATREDDGCKNVDAPEPISTTETQASGSTDDLRLQPVTPLSKKKNEKKLVDGKYYTIFFSLQSV